jgi:hypothetical protein
MPYIPPTLLKKLYVKGSLSNTEEGFAFKLKNTLAPGTIVAFKALIVDGNPCALESVCLITASGERPAAGVGSKTPFLLEINREVTVAVKGLKLEPGHHKITVKVSTKEVGDLEIPVEDEI